jgi:hypothetical protein
MADNGLAIVTTDLGAAGPLRRLVRSASESRRAAPDLAYASFQIFSRTLRPAFWTSYFGCTPTDWHVRGESRGPPGEVIAASGAPWARYKQGMWSLETRGQVKADHLDRHIEWLARRLRLPRVSLPPLLRRQGAQCRVFCFWDNYAGDRVPGVRRDLRVLLRRSGAGLEIDEYPQQMTMMGDGPPVKVWV